MNIHVALNTIFITLFILVAIVVIPASAVTGNGAINMVEKDSGYTLLDGMGISAADRESLTEQAKVLQANLKTTASTPVSATSATGSYIENSIEKITTRDGKPFEGGTTIKFVISPDNQVSGTVDFKFIEQGWTITIHGTVTGFLTPDTGRLIIRSSDAFLKYAGKTYPIVMEVTAQYNGKSFDGTKDLTMAGTSGTLGFHAETTKGTETVE